MGRDFGRVLSFNILVILLRSATFVISYKPQVPCYFIFGDSWVDNGNNNKLDTKCKVNYPPYGVDFPDGNTGRFTNGRTTADIIGQLLGFEEFIPPYATASDKQISRGVNYGSGSAGIRKESGRQLGERINLDMQLRHHKSIISRLYHLRKNNKKILRKCIYLVNMGSNDYVNNFFLPDSYNTSNMFTRDEYAQVLIRQYSKQLKTLVRLEARKIVVFGLAKLGCSPVNIERFGTKGKPCVESINNAVDIFNHQLISLIEDLNDNNSDATFTYINLASILAPLGDVPLPSAPCCKLREDRQCIRDSVPCAYRDLSIFFDGFHPTEVANMIIAMRSYAKFSPLDACPYDISHLAQL
ncbi:GDSL esterase/lipase At5g45670-like [Rutidosis leptorrhynchoides]|uniref:GDSL esterase/lipase At5g45670-like n=1 Tax=Rutidosis leptorrhynchoides TaxID=125765 RepID=UPI003A999FC1